MRIRIHCDKRPTGVPPARVQCVWAVDDHGASWVNILISALDAHDIATVVASLRMSPSEARGLATQLTLRAQESEVAS